MIDVRNAMILKNVCIFAESKKRRRIIPNPDKPEPKRHLNSITKITSMLDRGTQPLHFLLLFSCS
jgi:hypothetical protein